MTSVSQPTAAFTKRSAQFAKIRAWLEGDECVKKAEYINAPSNWDEKEKAAFIEAAYVFNATKRTIDGLSGMVMIKPATIDLPPEFDAFKTDADGKDTNLEGVINKVADELCGVGNIGLLVDFPTVSGQLTKAQAEAQGMKPVFSFYAVESILEVKHTKRGGKSILSRVRLVETYTEQGADEFAETEKLQYRVLDLDNGLYRQRLYRNNKLIDVIEPKANGSRLTEIPFRLITATGDVDKPCRPPLSDLAQVNIDHLNDSAWRQRAIRFAGSPLFAIFGMAPPKDPVRAGDGMMIFVENPQGKLQVEAAKAENVGAIREAMQDKRDDMAVIGARFLQAETNANIAENTATIHRSGDNATLSTISASIEQGITQALKWVALFLGLKPDIGGVKLSRDYLPRKMTSQELQAIVAAWQAGAMTIADLYDNLVNGEIIQPREGGFEDYDLELAQEALDKMPNANDQAAALPNN